jgi:FAD/FMN-containing dehydrogenase
MALYNITVVAAGPGSVGANGGWFGYGGHGFLTSYYGLGSDQGLSLQVVTADGRFVTADPFTNSDLFYALRGGGAGRRI